MFKKRTKAISFNALKLVVPIITHLAMMVSVDAMAQSAVVVIPMAGDDLKPLANIVTVAKANGDFTNPVDAVDSITDASASNPYLVVIAPGEYQLTEPLNMQSHVDISGSGINSTVLIGPITSATQAGSALINGISDASITGLSLENTGSAGLYSSGIYNQGDSPSISNIRIKIHGDGTKYGIYNSTSSPVIYDIEIAIDGASTANNYGIYNSSGTPKVSDTVIRIKDGAKSYGIYQNAGTYYISDVNILVEDGTDQWGINTNTGTVVISGAHIRLSDMGDDQWGIYGNAGVDATITGVQINLDPPASGGDDQYGIFSNTSVNALIGDTRILIDDGPSSDYGVYANTGSARTKLSNAYIQATTGGFRTSTSSTADDSYLSNVVFEGGGVSGNKTYCSFVFIDSDDDGSFNSQLDANCN